MLDLVDTILSKLTSSKWGKIFLSLSAISSFGLLGYFTFVALDRGGPSAQTRQAASNRAAIKAEFMAMLENDLASVIILGGLLLLLLAGYFLLFSSDTTTNSQLRDLQDYRWGRKRFDHLNDTLEDYSDQNSSDHS